VLHEKHILFHATVKPAFRHKIEMEGYSGYLSAHLPLIRELHGRGASTGDIAAALFAAGARAGRSDPHAQQLTRSEHIVNLRAMTLYVLALLGLRRRRVRVLHLKANKNGGRPGVPPDLPNSKTTTMIGPTHGDESCKSSLA
jgi:hypothetical protein